MVAPNTKHRNSKVLIANVLTTINSAVVGFFLVISVIAMRIPEYAAELEQELNATFNYQDYGISVEALMQYIAIFLIGFMLVMVIMAALGWFAYVMNNKGLVLASAIIYIIVCIILLLFFNVVALLIFAFYYVACGLYIYAYSQMSHTNTMKPQLEQVQYPESSSADSEDEIHIID